MVDMYIFQQLFKTEKGYEETENLIVFFQSDVIKAQMRGIAFSSFVMQKLMKHMGRRIDVDEFVCLEAYCFGFDKEFIYRSYKGERRKFIEVMDAMQNDMRIRMEQINTSGYTLDSFYEKFFTSGGAWIRIVGIADVHKAFKDSMRLYAEVREKAALLRKVYEGVDEWQMTEDITMVSV